MKIYFSSHFFFLIFFFKTKHSSGFYLFIFSTFGQPNITISKCFSFPNNLLNFQNGLIERNLTGLCFSFWVTARGKARLLLRGIS